MVNPLRVAFVEWPENLSTDHPQWTELKAAVTDVRPDILVTNELPFGPWLAEKPCFSEDDANRSIRLHEQGMQSLTHLNLPAVISSRPVWNETRLANEAYVLENGTVRPLHRKQYFPNEAGWYESAWYAGDGSGFTVAEVQGISVGVLLCTDAMFNEHARAYGKQKAALIVIPRATGTEIRPWRIAGAMASLISGAYVVSSNRVGFSRDGIQFGGSGFAYAPQGRLIKATDHAHPVQMFDLDPELPTLAQRAYPCYVAESEHGCQNAERIRSHKSF